MADLTNKQKMFIKEYLIDLNATQAAIRAGYSEKTAKSQGQRLFTNVDVQSAIQAAMKKREEKTEITAELVLKELAKIAQADLKDFVEFSGDIETETEEERDGKKVIVKTIRPVIRVKDSEDIDGTMISEVQETRDGLKFKLHDKMKALELIGKHLGMFTDKLNLSGEVGVKIVDDVNDTD